MTRNAARAFAAGADETRGKALDSGFDSAEQAGREQQKQAAAARAAEQSNFHFPPIGFELLMYNLRPIQRGRKGKTLGTGPA